MSEQILITLTVPPRLEDTCIELLLEHPSTPAFSSAPGRGHGEHPDHLSLSEQVSGWRREVRIEVLVAAADRAALLDDLRTRLPTDDVRYLITPVIEAGSFGSA